MEPLVDHPASVYNISKYWKENNYDAALHAAFQFLYNKDGILDNVAWKSIFMTYEVGGYSDNKIYQFIRESDKAGLTHENHLAILRFFSRNDKYTEECKAYAIEVANSTSHPDEIVAILNYPWTMAVAHKDIGESVLFLSRIISPFVAMPFAFRHLYKHDNIYKMFKMGICNNDMRMYILRICENNLISAKIRSRLLVLNNTLHSLS